MAQTTNAPTESKATQLEAGTYEIIQNRLLQQTDVLKQRIEQLNTARKTVFGAIETQLIANDRINTSNFCIARDIIALGDNCIFGYNVHIGLRSGIKLEDVFSIYSFNDNRFLEADLGILRHEKFETDFQNLYRYYKDAFFARFVRQGTYLYMLFQVSANPKDIKAFKWLVKGTTIEYIDARSEHEVRLPEQHEFRWNRATRDMQRMGRHPHISILDRIFVETVGGDLTIKVEDNTDDGRGIYREEVDFKDQTLDDAEYFYADLGNLVVLKIRPYQERARFFIYNEKIQQVKRINALEDSGILLPDGHGLIFPNGYYLQTGEFKIFDPDLRNKHFVERINSPNGEDYLYVFHNIKKGTYVLMHYNLIEQKVNTPIICHGFTLFPNGELAYFRAEEEPTKHHLVQLWQTPFVAGEQVPSEYTDSYLYKVGNKDIVRAMAEAYEILILVGKDDSYSDLYNDLAKKCTDILDSYYWIDKQEAFSL
ncbi:MAG: DNA repair ATPase, partial [Bacteroidota bacterium]